MNEKEILEEFDKLGQMIIKDRECGDMPYSELANWSVIKAFISKSLSDQRAEIVREVEKLYRYLNEEDYKKGIKAPDNVINQTVDEVLFIIQEK